MTRFAARTAMLAAYPPARPGTGNLRAATASSFLPIAVIDGDGSLNVAAASLPSAARRGLTTRPPVHMPSSGVLAMMDGWLRTLQQPVGLLRISSHPSRNGRVY